MKGKKRQWHIVVFLYIISHLGLGYGTNPELEVEPFEFVEEFDDAFSKYIFGYKNCYHYKVSHDVTDHCSLSAPDIDDSYSILKTSTWKRLLLNNAMNKHCYIATLYICPSRPTDEVKRFALEHIQIPSQTCFETNVIHGKNGDGIGIQLFKAMDCVGQTQMEDATSPFVFCTAINTDTEELVDTAEFCFHINGEQRCFNDFDIPNLCEEETYDQVTQVTQYTTDAGSDIQFITSYNTRWLIGILSVIGLCVLAMFMVFCGWKYYPCQSVAEEEYTQPPWQRKPCALHDVKDEDHDRCNINDSFDETIEYDDGRELAQEHDLESEEEEQGWRLMLNID